MKYRIPIAMALTLLGCDKNSSEYQNNARVTDEQIPGYLVKPLQGKVSQRGLYRMVRSGGIMDNPKTTTGKVVSSPVIQLIKSTERIPLIKGAQMYLQYRIWPFPNQPAYVDLRRVLKHPEMKLSDKSITTGSDFQVKRKVSSNHIIVYTGYGFDEDYELIEGDWVFEIWHADKKLIEQKFTTYWPDEAEIAKLKPMLKLGNKVLTKMQSPTHSDSRLNWPRVLVGEKSTGVPDGVAEVFADQSKTNLKP